MKTKNIYQNPNENLFLAIHANNLELVVKFIKEGASLNYTEKGKTPISLAAELKRWPIVKTIASLQMTTDHEDTFQYRVALLNAVKEKQLEVAHLLLKANAPNEYWAANGTTSLHEAALNNWPEIVAMMLDREFDYKQKDNNGKTARESNPDCFYKGWEICQYNRNIAVISILFIQAARQPDSFLFKLPFELLDKVLHDIAGGYIINPENTLRSKEKSLLRISAECFLDKYDRFWIKKQPPTLNLFQNIRQKKDSPHELKKCVANFVKENGSKVNVVDSLKNYHLINNDVWNEHTRQQVKQEVEDFVHIEEKPNYKIVFHAQINVIAQSLDPDCKLSEVKLEYGEMKIAFNSIEGAKLFYDYCKDLQLSPHIMNEEIIFDSRQEIEFYIFNKCKLPLEVIYKEFPEFKNEKPTCVIG